ncbi:MAG: VCBS repeat-containing protein [Planctomycetes bacterium]|nr:VCBS repeat-containing protein [Planctomycetota bacterium]
MRRLRVLPRLSVLLLALSASGCGAGLISGVIASDDGSPRPAPEINLTTRMPLVPAAETSRTVVVANAQITDARQVRVLLTLGEPDSPGAVVAEQSAVVVTPGGASTTIRFAVETGPILARFPDPTAQDVAVGLSVLVGGRLAAPVLPVTLLRQPVATRRLEAGESEFLSAAGGSTIKFAVRGMLATRAADVQVFVRTADGNGVGDLVRPCTVTGLARNDLEAVVDATVPGSVVPGAATFFLVDPVAGRSTDVDNIWYQPDLAQLLPGRGATAGGTIVTLTGTALVPPLPGQGQPDFDRVTLRFRKGDREIVLAADDLRRDESGVDRLVFRMPASPDGRPGRVTLSLAVDLGVIRLDVARENVFLFANAEPVFGPRGALLDRAPIAIAPIALEGAPGIEQATDLAVLYSEGGVSSLQLLLAQENGMFIRLGAPRQIGAPLVPGEREPRDLCAIDRDFDGVPDLFVLNRGGRHHVVQGQAAPASPLGAVDYVAAGPGSARCVAIELDPMSGGGAQRGVILLPGDDVPSARPELWIAAAGQIGLRSAGVLPVRAGLTDAATVADLDADGKADFAVAVGGAAPKVDVAFGDGQGGFHDVAQLDFAAGSVFGYTPEADSPVVGLHVCGSPAEPWLAMVFAGGVTGTAPPTIAVLRRNGRTYELPTTAEFVNGAPIGRLGVSLGANLDGIGADELVVSSGVNPTRLIVANWDAAQTPPRFSPRVFAGEGFTELRSISAMRFGLAIPRDRSGNSTRAVFVLHDADVDGQIERRVSTLLVGEGTALNEPVLAGAPSSSVQAVIGGSFTAQAAQSGGRLQDLAVATASSLMALSNGGGGAFFGPAGNEDVPDLIGESLARVRITATGHDALVVATTAGEIYCWDPQVDGRPVGSGDLRPLSPLPALHTTPLSTGAVSRLRGADVDGDGIIDLIALLHFATTVRQDGESLLLLLRGKATVAPGEFPFLTPVGVGTTHGQATDFAVGDLVGEATPPQRLELAVAVPRGATAGSLDGDHIRFYRLLPGTTAAEDRFVRSFDNPLQQVLLAGTAPTLMRAADFDGNGTTDLAVAAAGDQTLRLFLNAGRIPATSGEVRIDSFREIGSPRQLLTGEPKFLRLADIDGDGNIDVFSVTEVTVGPLATRAAFYISSGDGRFEAPVEVSRTRIGSGRARIAADLADFNDDGMPDLLLGLDGESERSVRVLFGGSR